MAEQFEANERRWNIFKVLDPNLVVPSLRIGPFQGWHSTYFKDSSLPMEDRTFGKLVKLKRDELIRNSKIAELMANFPSQTQLIGGQFLEGEIVCIEGSHRSTALTLAQEIEQPIDFSTRQMTIALTQFGEEERGVLEAMLQRGSHKV